MGRENKDAARDILFDHMTRPSKPKTLMLVAHFTDKLSYYDDWEDAFKSAPELDVTVINIADGRGRAILEKTIEDYDLIALMHSTNGGGVQYLLPYKDLLLKRKGKLLTFCGNEVNIPHISLREKIDYIRDIRAEYIGTQLPIETGRWLFEECGTSKVIPLPHAVNTEVFRPVKRQEDRNIDIGVRSNRYLPHLGDNERNDLFDFFLNTRFQPPLELDISMTKRFDRAGWASFLNECKATLANEAGTYYLEKDDRTVQEIQLYIEEKARKANMRVVSDKTETHPLWWRILPVGIRKGIKSAIRPLNIVGRREVYKLVDFREIYDLFYKDYKKTAPYGKCISSRHFDAIGTKTCQIMFDGRFNDILKADQHYIALRRDFSNIDDVMKRFQDISYRTRMVDHTYDYIMESHTYRHRIRSILSRI